MPTYRHVEDFNKPGNLLFIINDGRQFLTRGREEIPNHDAPILPLTHLLCCELYMKDTKTVSVMTSSWNLLLVGLPLLV